MRTLLLFASALMLVGCTGPQKPDTPLQPVRDWGAWLTLLNLEDTRNPDPEAWRTLLSEDQPGLRARVVRAMGRTRARALTPLLLETLEQEQAPELVTELLFAVGQLGDPQAVAAVISRTLAPHQEPAVRARACDALGKLKDPIATTALLQRLDDDDASVRGAACLALARLRGRRVKPPLAWEDGEAEGAFRQLSHLTRSDPSAAVRWRAVYALGNIDLPDRLPVLETALALSGARSRLFAVRGLGRIKPGNMKPEVRAGLNNTLRGLLLADVDLHVRASAARALGALGGATCLPDLLTAAQDTTSAASHHARRTAIRALGKILTRSKTGSLPARDALRKTVEADPSYTVRLAAIEVLAGLDPVWVRARLQRDVKHTDSLRRRAAAAGAAALAKVPAEHGRAWEILAKLASDKEPSVAAAALDGLGEAWDPKHSKTHDLRAQVLTAIQHGDLAVRGTALSLLSKAGTPADRSKALVVLWASTSAEEAELRVEAVKVIAKLGKDDPGATALTLEGALDDRSPAVRRAARTAIASLTGKRANSLPAPASSEQPSSVQLRLGRDVYSKAANPRAVLTTTQGSITLELLREEAPRHVASFVKLARARRYDGLIFHRVIAAFVAQGLDPRGDGWGTGGVFLRDEINPVPFLRGAVGMPNAGPDTGGCQIFVNHVPTPHLDGSYTVFARVVEGFAVLDALDVGDRVRSVRIARSKR